MGALAPGLQLRDELSRIDRSSSIVDKALGLQYTMSMSEVILEPPQTCDARAVKQIELL